MSTAYRAVITCDEQKSDRCLGLLELSTDLPRHLDKTHAHAISRGWLRGYGAERTFDVCPACRALLATEHAGVGVRLAPGSGANA